MELYLNFMANDSMNTLKLIGRSSPLFERDIFFRNNEIAELVSGSRFLVIGGAGSIGQAVTREIFKRNPLALHVVDISENNMVELVRDIRSTLGYIDGDFRTFAIDCGGLEYQALMNSTGDYDYILNLSALKHVRSEEDPFTLMRLIEVNILNTIKIAQIAREQSAKKYFCVSTDKAANPVNMMGASKRIMEQFLMRESEKISISTARFANVAFSDGSLLHGFNQRFAKQQPISAPNDVRRYFLTPQESGELCLMSCLLGENRDIFFPKLSAQLNLTTFSDIAERYLEELGYEPYQCSSEQEARDRSAELISSKRWPCYFFKSDTTGEKDFEEFFTDSEILDMSQFQNLGVIKNDANYNCLQLNDFISEIENIRKFKSWEKTHLVELFNQMIPDFKHKETGKYLDGRM
jgi:FlaA1/EpsC-like NDP-sugar epimerase